MNFNLNEQDVLHIRAEIRRLGITRADLRKVPIEVGLQTDEGYPHRGTLDYVSPTVNQATGTLAVRAILQNAQGVLVPGYFVRVRVGIDEQNTPARPGCRARQRPGRALRARRQQGRRGRAAQSHDRPEVGELRAIDSGLKGDDRVVVSGILRAIPGQKVDPQQQQTAAATPAPAAGAK